MFNCREVHNARFAPDLRLRWTWETNILTALLLPSREYLTLSVGRNQNGVFEGWHLYVEKFQDMLRRPCLRVVHRGRDGSDGIVSLLDIGVATAHSVNGELCIYQGLPYLPRGCAYYAECVRRKSIVEMFC